MNKDIIGIKLSDGSFYPVLTDGKATGKQLNLTTARDGQTSIRLHLYRSALGTMDDAEYLDSLRIDNLNSHAMNEPTVSLSLNIDDNGVLSAELSDPETGTFTSKRISPDQVSDMPDIPDFDVDFDIPEPKDSSEFDVPPLTEEDLDFGLDDSSLSPTASLVADISSQSASNGGTDEDFSMQNSPFTDSSLYDGLSHKGSTRKGNVSIPLAVCIICAIICLCVLGIMFFVAPPKWMTKVIEVPAYNFDAQLIPDEASDDQPSPNEDIIIVADTPIVPEQPAIVEPDAGTDNDQIRHLIKWGDTLWDLAGCYYKNPWAYPRIAKANNIKNPDYIISGTIIVIPR